MSDLHARVHLRLTTQAEVMSFIQALCKFEDAFSIESRSGEKRVNAKSVIAVLYTISGFPEEIYLVNDTHEGLIPPFVNQYIMPA